MSNPTNTNGLLMPSDFDHLSYDYVQTKVSSKSRLNPDAWDHFGASWSGVSYRFRACIDHSNTFTEAITTMQSMENRYIQERELFGFFVTGLSVIESFCFAMFAMGSMLQPTNFPLQTEEDERKVTPCETADKYNHFFANDDITKEIRNLIGIRVNRNKKSCQGGEKNFEEWSNIRNILTHRESTTRLFFLQGLNSQVKPQSPQWKRMPNFDFDQNTTESRRIWLSETLNNLLKETKSFVEIYFT